MKIIKVAIIIILLGLLWIFKPIILSYFNNNEHTTPIEYINHTDDKTDLDYSSSYEKKLYRHKSSNKNHIDTSGFSIFECDGRQHCSQMRSYEEAKYFITHCPDTKMDGDNDGIPCERQFRRYD